LIFNNDSQKRPSEMQIHQTAELRGNENRMKSTLAPAAARHA
jgi:hypothetical protein